MGVIDATYAAVSGMYTGTGNATISSIVRYGDAKVNHASPFCIVHLTPMRAMESSGMQAVRVVFEVHVPRQQDFARNDAIIAQLKSDYDGKVPPTSGGYDFTPMVWMSSDQRNNVDERVLIETYDLIVFSGGSAPFLGYEAGISGYDGGRAFYFELTEGKPIIRDTRWIDSRERYTSGMLDGGGFIRMFVTKEPLPSGTYSNVVFTLSTGVAITRTIVTGPSRMVVPFGKNKPQVVDVPFSITEVDP